MSVRVCVRVCVRACVSVCVRVCVRACALNVYVSFNCFTNFLVDC